MVYQVYLRSFSDSNTDGIGDFQGLIAKVDYLKALGVETIWLSPVYASPNDDNGYDISDYHAIHPDYGTMKDFDELLVALKKRGMRLLMDQVVNHTSDEHPWFVEARSSVDSPKRDWYHWHQGKPGPVPPNNWRSAFDDSAWAWNEATGDYYLHLFSRKQPDLNWTNPEVRREIQRMLQWWLDKGVDGFRLDVINMIAKAPGWPDAVRADWDKSPGDLVQLGGLSCNQPGVHDYLRELKQAVFAGRDVFTVGEVWCVDAAGTIDYTHPETGHLDSVFQFYFHYCKTGAEHWENFCGLYEKTRGRAWLTTTLGNHDSRRSLSKFGSPERYPVESASLLAAWTLTLPATPFLMQGEELGLTDVCFDKIGDYRDISTLNRYKAHLAQGDSEEEALRKVRLDSRDNARTPIPWDDSMNGGFSSATPWLQVSPDHLRKNVAAALSDPGSIFSHYRELIALRKSHPTLIHGDFTPLVSGSKNVLAYRRELEGEAPITIVLNWQDDQAPVPDAVTDHMELLWSNRGGSFAKSLRPWEAIVARG